MLALVLVDQFLLTARARSSRIRQQLRVTGPIHTHEPEGGLIDTAPHRQETMILQYHGLAPAQGTRYARPLVRVDNHTAKMAIDTVTFVEAERVLGDHVQLPPKHTERLAMDRVCVAGSVDIGSGPVNSTVDGERGSVDGLVPLHDPAFLVDEDQVRHLDLGEVHAQGVQPEVVRQYWVPDTDVAGDALVVAALGEDAEGGSQVGLAVVALFL